MPIPSPVTNYAAIVPAADRDQANSILQKHGYGPNNFSRELQTNGVTTHYGCQANIRQSQTGWLIGILPNTVEFSVQSLTDFAASQGLTLYTPTEE